MMTIRFNENNDDESEDDVIEILALGLGLTVPQAQRIFWVLKQVDSKPTHSILAFEKHQPIHIAQNVAHYRQVAFVYKSQCLFVVTEDKEGHREIRDVLPLTIN